MSNNEILNEIMKAIAKAEQEAKSSVHYMLPSVIAKAVLQAIRPYLRTTEPDEGKTADEIYQNLAGKAKILGLELRKPEPVSGTRDTENGIGAQEVGAAHTEQPIFSLLGNGMIKTNSAYQPEAGEVWEIAEQPVECFEVFRKLYRRAVEDYESDRCVDFSFLSIQEAFEAGWREATKRESGSRPIEVQHFIDQLCAGLNFIGVEVTWPDHTPGEIRLTKGVRHTQIKLPSPKSPEGL